MIDNNRRGNIRVGRSTCPYPKEEWINFIVCHINENVWSPTLRNIFQNSNDLDKYMGWIYLEKDRLNVQDNKLKIFLVRLYEAGLYDIPDSYFSDLHFLRCDNDGDKSAIVHYGSRTLGRIFKNFGNMDESISLHLFITGFNPSWEIKESAIKVTPIPYFTEFKSLKSSGAMEFYDDIMSVLMSFLAETYFLSMCKTVIQERHKILQAQFSEQGEHVEYMICEILKYAHFTNNGEYFIEDYRLKDEYKIDPYFETLQSEEDDIYEFDDNMNSKVLFNSILFVLMVEDAAISIIETYINTNTTNIIRSSFKWAKLATSTYSTQYSYMIAIADIAYELSHMDIYEMTNSLLSLLTFWTISYGSSKLANACGISKEVVLTIPILLYTVSLQSKLYSVCDQFIYQNDNEECQNYNALSGDYLKDNVEL